MTDDAARELGAALAAIAPWSTYEISPDTMSGFLSTVEADAPRYALYVGDAPAGVVCLRMKWLRGPYLQTIGLLPAYQRQGIGLLVLNWFEVSARARGDRNLWIVVSDFNSDAARLYERFGFQRIGTLPDLMSDGINEFLMHKPLSA
ncbi:MAG: GNAT family N-acetyltransferase [Hyphomicrobium sp.]